MEAPKIEFYQLRDFGKKINATIEFLRENFKSLFLCLLLIGGPAALLLSLVFKNLMSAFSSFDLESGTGSTPSDALSFFSLLGGNYFVLMLLSWLTVTLIAGVTFSYMKLYNQGVAKETSVGEVFRLALSKYGGLLILGFIISVVTIIGMFFFFLPGIFLGVVLSLAYPIYMFEDVGVGKAFSKSFTLIRDKWWSTFGLIIIASLIAYLVQAVFSVPFIVVYMMEMFTIVEDLEANSGDPSSIFGLFSSGYMTLTMALSMVGSYLTYSIPMVALGYQYANLIERSEGRGLMDEIKDFDAK
ncbi:MAG: hypothetical protein ABJG78_12915 [Cyclobacteriaceae bacterium]